MRDETHALLQAMERWPWFENVGDPIEDLGVIPVVSWDNAVELCGGNLWEVTRLQTHNRYTKEVRARDWTRANQWNSIVEQINEAIRPLVDARGRVPSTRLSLPELFVHQVDWDILGICMEAEYADIYPPLFYANILAPWYRTGHFPCGWDGPELQPGWRSELPPHRLHVF